MKYFLGAEDYHKGKSESIEGIKYIDEYTYSVTIPANALEYYYDFVNVSLRHPSLAYDDVIKQVALLTAETMGYATENTKAII